MGKYSTGLDWSAVMAMAGALESTHTCRVELTVTTRGQAHNGSMHLVIKALFDTLPGSDLPKAVEVRSDYPTSKCKTVEGLVYNLLWQLDYAIGQAYEQMTSIPA